MSHARETTLTLLYTYLPRRLRFTFWLNFLQSDMSPLNWIAFIFGRDEVEDQ